jgi:hypothetical protein
MKRAGMLILTVTCAGGLLCGAGRFAVAQQMPSSEEAGTGSSAQDAKLEKRIDYRLQHDKKLKARGLDASVKDGVVTLTGTVLTSAEKAKAARLAHTKGVSDIENQINVQGQEESQGSTGTVAPQGAGESNTPAPNEGQPAQPSPEGQVRERTTHTEERTETRTERVPQPAPDQQQQAPSSAPSNENVPPPAAPNPPQAPAPRSTVPQQ